MDPAFDVREFAQTARGSLREDVGLASFAEHPLPSAMRRLLGILAALEGATMAQLRDVLVTATHKDARITAFLVSWAYEKFWIADALSALSRAGGESPIAVPLTERRRAAGPVRRSLAGFLEGESVIGVHMLDGAIDDRMLTAAYERMGARTDRRELVDALSLIVTMKQRHTAFFSEEAARRLRTDARARRLARRELLARDWPLGIERLDDVDRAAFDGLLRSGGGGAAEKVVHFVRGLDIIDADADADDAVALRRRLERAARNGER